MPELLDIDVDESARAILNACRRGGLVVRDLGCLKMHPGSRHWHVRRPEGPGTLEVTEHGGRVWITVKPRWDGGWASSLARKLAAGRSVD